ncbi:hypothetical protein IJ732_05220 [bacterium]|nr:hypothetical protein [bacterium]
MSQNDIGYTSLQANALDSIKRHFNSTLNAVHTTPCHYEPERREGVAILCYRKVAFTLAEVLITLGIIGVVAALTIPTLMQKTNERETVSKVKKMFSVLTNAYSNYKVDNENNFGEFEMDEEGSTGVFNMFKPYLNIAKNCGTGETDCMFNGAYSYKNGSIQPQSLGPADYAYKAILSDGSLLIFRGNPTGDHSPVYHIFYDVNGEKGPNSWGKDYFEFDVLKDKIIPAGVPESNDPFDEHCASDNSEGWGCAAWIIYKDNLDYLKCNDLSWNGKQKCD